MHPYLLCTGHVSGTVIMMMMMMIVMTDDDVP